MLIPLYVLVGVWGGTRRLAATLTFVVYTMAGSLLMLASVVAFGVTQGTFSLVDSGTSDNVWIFLGFAVAFAIKAPLFPFHGWLPLAYREAPVEVAAVLSAIVSKTAIYGFLRIGLPKFPEPVDDLTVLVLVLAARRARLRVAYSRSARPTCAGSSRTRRWRRWASSPRGIRAERSRDRRRRPAVGRARPRVRERCSSSSGWSSDAAGPASSTRSAAWPVGGRCSRRCSIATGIIALAVPGSATFAGEFLIMAGVYGEGWGYAAIVALGIVLAAMYTLRLISAVLHVRPGRAVRDEALDLRPGELALVLPLVACLLALSAWPALVSESSFPDDRPAQVIAEGFR